MIKPIQIIPVALLLLMGLLVGQEDAAAVTEAVTGLKTAIKEKQDPDQIHFVKILGEKWGAADEKQRKEILKLVPKNLKSKNQAVVDATVEALGLMNGGKKEKDAAAATKILVAETKKKETEKNVTYYALVLRSIGRLQHPNGAEILIKLLKYKDYDVRAAAVSSLSQFRESEYEIKKEAVSEIIKMFTSAASAAAGNRDTTATNRLEKVRPACESTLKTLTNQKVAGADAWQKWWNKEGKKSADWAKVEKS